MRWSDVRRAFEATALAALAALAMGCATLGKPAGQTVRIETPGCSRASCELSNDHGTWRLDSTPGEVSVVTSKEDLIVRCRAGEDAVADLHLTASAKPTGTGALGGGLAGGAAAGAVFGSGLMIIPPLGVMALLTGVAVGAVAGQTAEASQTALRYPDVIRVPMLCPDASTRPAIEPETGEPHGTGITK